MAATTANTVTQGITSQACAWHPLAVASALIGTGIGAGASIGTLVSISTGIHTGKLASALAHLHANLLLHRHWHPLALASRHSIDHRH